MELFRSKKKTTYYGLWQVPCILFLKKHAILCMYDTSKKKEMFRSLSAPSWISFCTIVIFFRVISFQHKFINMFMHTWGYLENEGSPKKRNPCHPPKINMSPEQKGKVSFQAAFLSRDSKGTPPMPHFLPRNSLPSYTSRWL